MTRRSYRTDGVELCRVADAIADRYTSRIYLLCAVCDGRAPHLAAFCSRLSPLFALASSTYCCRLSSCAASRLASESSPSAVSPLSEHVRYVRVRQCQRDVLNRSPREAALPCAASSSRCPSSSSSSSTAARAMRPRSTRRESTDTVISSRGVSSRSFCRCVGVRAHSLVARSCV